MGSRGEGMSRQALVVCAVDEVPVAIRSRIP
jgi:hypothetical protein